MMWMLGSDRARAFGTCALLVIEEGLMLALPALIGIAIDHLIAGQFDGLRYLVGAVLAVLGFGTMRRFLDTRLYVRVQNRLSLNHLGSAAAGSVSARAAHLRLVGEVTQFFEIHVPQGIGAVFAGLGALGILALYNARVALIAAGCTVLLFGLNAIYAAATAKLNARINNRLEHEVGVVSAVNPARLARHLRVLGGLRIARSDAETVTYGLYWVILLGLFVAALLLIVDTGASAGAVFAQMSYVLGFAESWNAWPTLIERYTQMRDVAKRLTHGRPTAGA